MACVPVTAQAQQGLQTPGQAPAASADPAKRILLNVMVTDKAGNPVAGLTQQDFTLLDNKQPAAIADFHAYSGADQPSDPPQAIVVVDSANMPYTDAQRSLIGIDRFLRENGGHLAVQTAVVVLDDSGIKGDFETATNGNALADDLKATGTHFRSIGTSAAGWGEVERFQVSVQALTTVMQNLVQQPGRKLVLWVGPGWPLLNGTNELLSSRAQMGDFNEILYFSQMLRQEQITLDSVALGQPDIHTMLYHGFLKGVKSPKDALPSDLNSKVLATESGGLVLGPDNDLTPQLENCFRDATTYYTLAFDPPRPDKRDEYHDLQVVVKGKPGLTVRTNTSYYAEP
jgi:VWFA-related protein